MINISSSMHPDYLAASVYWEKYRYIKDSGDDFIEKYLVKFSQRESVADFADRKSISTTKAFARGAIEDVKNAIFQRMSDISRLGGSKEYSSAVSGENLGVDLEGSTMNHFIGRHVLPEMLFLGKVGVFVDMPRIEDNITLADSKGLRPYLYTYKAEAIKNWSFDFSSHGTEFKTLLLEEAYLTNDELGLPSGTKYRYRFLSKENGVVKVKLFNTDSKQIDIHGEISEEDYIINIPKIPFVLFELDQPLTKDIANHQIALMNMESSDISWILRASLPFYTEQTDQMAQAMFMKNEVEGRVGKNTDAEIGANHGRSYGKGMERPGFIHPSSEPLKASMEKQKELKDDIRMLINLALSNVQSKYSSAESKEMDERGLESGLSNLGLILEHGERQIAQIFAYYENTDDVATINYPQKYSLKTDAQRLKEAESLGVQRETIPSSTFQRAISKEIANILVGAKVSKEDLDTIISEIDDAVYMTSKAEDIHKDIEHGLVSLKTAAVARGYSEDEVEKAAKDHTERLLRIKLSQTSDNDNDNDNDSNGARGVADESGDPVNDSRVEKAESQNPDLSPTGKKQVRGEAK
jgi:hypothetical protein